MVEDKTMNPKTVLTEYIFDGFLVNSSGEPLDKDAGYSLDLSILVE